MPFRFAAMLYCAAALTPLVATAQQSTRISRPTDAAAPVPVVKYQSAFTGYVPFRDENLAPWREVNDEAARVGGHLGIFGGAAGRGATGAPPMKHDDGHQGMKK